MKTRRFELLSGQTFGSTALNLSQLEAFVETCHQGSYTRAAARLFLSQPALYHRVKELEAELQTPLLVVQNRRVVPTAKGQEVLEVGERVLRELHDLEERVRGRGDGQSVHIGTVTLLVGKILSDSIKQFRTSRPHTAVEVLSLDVNDIYDALISNRVDAVIAFPGYAAPDLEVEPLMKVEFIWTGAVGHPLADGELHEPSELLAYPLALTERGMGQRTRVTEWFRKMTGEIDIQPSFEARSAGLLAQVAASAPLFLSVLPRTALEQYRLAEIRVRDHKHIAQAVLCYLPTHQRRPVVEEFLALLRESAKQETSLVAQTP